MAAVVLAGGRGVRMGAGRLKVLQPLAGHPLLEHVLRAVGGLDPAHVVVVVGHRADEVRAAFPDRRILWADQVEPLGTAHAFQAGLGALPDGFRGDLLAVCGDMPLLRAETLGRLLDAHRAAAADVTLLTAEVDDPTGYGRVLRSPDGAEPVRIVEESELSGPAERKVREVSTGTWCFRSETVSAVLGRIGRQNRKGEYFLTDVVPAARERRLRARAVVAPDPSEAQGVNSHPELWRAAERLRERALAEHAASGVVFLDPRTTILTGDVTIGPGSVIHPFTVITGPVTIGRNCHVGPFAHLREGAVLEDRAEVGNFCEVKKSVLGPGSKAKHLTYLGDATIGSGVNIGAGTITANYDGKAKHRTLVRDRAFIGSGTVLIAPVEVGVGAVTGAGAVVRRGTPVADGEVWVGVPARRLENRNAPRVEPTPGRRTAAKRSARPASKRRASGRKE